MDCLRAIALAQDHLPTTSAAGSVKSSHRYGGVLSVIATGDRSLDDEAEAAELPCRGELNAQVLWQLSIPEARPPALPRP
jgi:hypothetical protein